jgi:hypothetical protein
MLTKVALYTLQSEASAPELEGPMGCCEGDTCVDLCVHLEAVGVLDWSFQFWDYDQKYRIKNKMERPSPYRKQNVCRASLRDLERGRFQCPLGSLTRSNLPRCQWVPSCTTAPLRE